MHVKDHSVYFLQTFLKKENGSTPVRSFLSLRLVPSSERERDGGFLVEDEEGLLLEVRSESIRGTILVLCSNQSVLGVRTRIVRKLSDTVLSKRIIEYMRNYYLHQHTNCSTLVEYLRTGVFVECDPCNQYFMFSAGMNLYTGQKIEPGDSLCVLYYRGNILSRRVPAMIRNSCKGNKGRLFLHELRIPKKRWNLTSEGLLDLYRSGLFQDYHFMFCIGIDNGSPILIQQVGWKEPGGDEGIDPAIVVTIGTTNAAPSNMPACMFIKKGRK